MGCLISSWISVLLLLCVSVPSCLLVVEYLYVFEIEGNAPHSKYTPLFYSIADIDFE